jgi:hypothetical protein
VLNEKLLEVMAEDVTQDHAFAHANDVLKNAVGGTSDIIHVPGLVNTDFEDVQTVMSEPGKAMMGRATAAGPDRATKAADQAVACPLRRGTDGLPVLTQPAVAGSAAAAPLGATPAYDALQTPSVWRRHRPDQAAAKAEALVSNGMDEIEIPAFLRKQAD